MKKYLPLIALLVGGLSFSYALNSGSAATRAEAPVQVAERLDVTVSSFLVPGGTTEADTSLVEAETSWGYRSVIFQGRGGPPPRLRWDVAGRLWLDAPPPLIDHFANNFDASHPEAGSIKVVEIRLGPVGVSE